MKRLLLLSLLFILCMSLVQTNVEAKVPHVLNYQAQLLDANNQPLNKTVPVEFKIYNSEYGGNPLWLEIQDVTASAGFVNVYLGTINPINLPFDQQYWLEVKIGNGTPYPRTRMTSVGQSIHSFLADTAEWAQNVTENGVKTFSIANEAVTQEKLAPGVQAIPWGQAGGDLAGDYPNPTLRPGAVIDNIEDGSITQNKLAPNVTTPPSGPASGDLTGEYPDPLIAVGAVKTDRIFDQAVTTEKIADDAVTGIKIANDAVGVSDLFAYNIDGYLSKPSSTFDNGRFLYYSYESADPNQMKWSAPPLDGTVAVWDAEMNQFVWTVPDISFADITSGTNTSATMIVAGDAILYPEGTGIVMANDWVYYAPFNAYEGYFENLFVSNKLTGGDADLNNVYIMGTLDVDGATNLNNTLGVDGASTFMNTVDIYGATNLYSTLNVDGATTLNSTLDVDGETTLNDILDVDGATTLNSTLDVDGDANFNARVGVDNDYGDLNEVFVVAADGEPEWTLTLDGLVYVNTDDLLVDNSATITNDLFVDDALDVDGPTTLNNTLDVQGVTNLWSTLDVWDATTLHSTLLTQGSATFQSSVDIYGYLNVDGPTTLNNTLDVDGATTLNNTLDVQGVTNIWNTLDVWDATTLHSTLLTQGSATFQSSVDIYGYLNVDGPTTLNNTLDVDGATTLNNTLDVQGETSLWSTLDVYDATNLWSTLDVWNATILHSTLLTQGSATFQSSVDIYGYLNVDGPTTLNNTLDVDGATTLNNTLDVQGATNIWNTLDVWDATELHSTLDVDNNANFDGMVGVDEYYGVENEVFVVAADGEPEWTKTLDGLTLVQTTDLEASNAEISNTLNVLSTAVATFEAGSTTNFDGNVNLNGATDITGTLDLDGDPGQVNDVMVSNGMGITPMWTNDLTLDELTANSATFFNLWVDGPTNLWGDVNIGDETTNFHLYLNGVQVPSTGTDNIWTGLNVFAPTIPLAETIINDPSYENIIMAAITEDPTAPTAVFQNVGGGPALEIRGTEGNNAFIISEGDALIQGATQITLSTTTYTPDAALRVTAGTVVNEAALVANNYNDDGIAFKISQGGMQISSTFLQVPGATMVTMNGLYSVYSVNPLGLGAAVNFPTSGVQVGQIVYVINVSGTFNLGVDGLPVVPPGQSAGYIYVQIDNVPNYGWKQIFND